MHNIFVTFLDLLGIKHTKSYANRYFNEHPHKYNLYGLSKMLTDYDVENVATRIPDKENNISEIETPFIAQFSGDFVVVDKIEPERISFLWKGAHHNLPVAKFVEAWTGIVLLAESSEKSGEPDYEKHRQTELINLLKKTAFFSFCGFFLLIAYLNYYRNNPISQLFGYSIMLLLNLAGLYISWLLLLKQINIDSQYADKICSLFKQKDCNNILESEAAKLFDIIGWSEIGFGYFLTNVLILLFAPALITSIALLNLFTLPYAFWGVWYQKAKAKQWCVLCLLVQIVLWGIFIVNCIFGLQIPALLTRELIPLLIVGGCYIFSMLAINLLIPKLNTEKTIQSLKQSLNSIKANEDVFKTLLMQQPFYEVSQSDSQILFGNPDAKLVITILTNPFCNPCAKMHARLENLLKETKGNVCIQYIFSSFNESLDYANRYMIAAYLNPPLLEGQEEAPHIPFWRGQGEATWQLLSDWFTKGKILREVFFEKLQLDMTNPAVEVEFQKHEVWKEKTQIRTTPTILVNWYKLPENYKIEDLRNFKEFDFKIK